MGPAPDRIISKFREIAKDAASDRPPFATSPATAGPDNATICPRYGWFGWTVQLSPPPKARKKLTDTVELARAVFQLMVDQLGVGDPAAMPDVNDLLRKAGLVDKKNKSLATDRHNDKVDKIDEVKRGLVDQHTKIADKVAETAKQGTELNSHLWNEVVDLRTAMHAAGSEKLSAKLETSLIDQVLSALQRSWKKFAAVANTNKKDGDELGPLTVSELEALAPKGDPGTLAKYLPYLNEAMRKAGISNPKREAAFLAQVLHETDGLRTLTEYGSEKYFNSNYGPDTAVGRSLGNEKPGDGARFRGRGALQITGRDNYRAAGDSIDVDLVRHPERAADPEHAFDIAGWYWESRELNDEADKGKLDDITREINGGSNGDAEREEYYRKARKVLDAD